MHKHYGWLPFLSSALIIVAFSQYQFSWVVFVAVVPYLFFLKQELTGKHPHIILRTWLMGLFACLGVTGWLAVADTGGWLQVHGMAVTVATFTVWLLLGACLSVGFVLFGYLLNRFHNKRSFFWFTLTILPLAWVVAEFGRSLFASLIASGPGGSFGANFNFGNLGYAGSATVVGFSARLIGLYGVSLLVVFVNVALFWASQKRYKPLLVVAVVLGLISVGGFYWPVHGSTIHIGVVQLPADDEYYYDSLTSALQNRTPNQPLDILVLPEYSEYLENSVPQQQAAISSAAFGNKNGVVVYSRHGAAQQGHPTNQIVVSDRNGHVTATLDKSFLIPSGEYLPWVIEGPLKAFGQSALTSYFDKEIRVAKSSSAESPIRANGVVYGVLACSGVITPNGYQTLAKHGASVLVNTASLNQFRRAKMYHQQAKQFAHFQAVANNRPFGQSAKGGNSYIINRNGRFVSLAGTDDIVVSAKVLNNTSRTPYSLFGEWLLVISLLTLVWFSFRSYSR